MGVVAKPPCAWEKLRDRLCCRSPTPLPHDRGLDQHVPLRSSWKLALPYPVPHLIALKGPLGGPERAASSA